jgi:hypothetical protein
MSAIEFRRDSKGLGEVAMSAGVQALCDAAARKIASQVSAQADPPLVGDEIAVEQYDFTPRGRTSDRAASSVTIKRWDGRLMQARDGILTRAAASIGAEVRAK